MTRVFEAGTECSSTRVVLLRNAAPNFRRKGDTAAGEPGSNGLTYFDPELSFSFAKTSSMLKLAAFCRCGTHVVLRGDNKDGVIKKPVVIGV